MAVNLGDVNAFSLVLSLLGNEYLVVAILLELLIREVNAHLLDAVKLEDFEAENVKHADGDLLAYKVTKQTMKSSKLRGRELPSHFRPKE
jgi:hypothetical protein